jgi:hypothetical protein
MAHQTRERPALRLKRLQAEHDNGYHETGPRMNCVACKNEVADLMFDHVLGLMGNGAALCTACDWEKPYDPRGKKDWEYKLDIRREWWDHIVDMALATADDEDTERELDVLADFG